ncbi:hypothetical protein ACFX15_046290 [Malus domestica]
MELTSWVSEEEEGEPEEEEQDGREAARSTAAERGPGCAGLSSSSTVALARRQSQMALRPNLCKWVLRTGAKSTFRFSDFRRNVYSSSLTGNNGYKLVSKQILQRVKSNGNQNNKRRGCWPQTSHAAMVPLLLHPCTAQSPRRGKLFFVSQTVISEALARRLLNFLTSNGVAFDLVDPSNYEPEDLPKETLVLIVASTWDDGKPPPNARFFSNCHAENAKDFRVGSLLLSNCRFAVFGVGSQAYGATLNAMGKDLARRMRAR